MPAIPVLPRLREGNAELQASLGNIMRPWLKKKKKKK
jgi:hypothetical protein